MHNRSVFTVNDGRGFLSRLVGCTRSWVWRRVRLPQGQHGYPWPVRPGEQDRCPVAQLGQSGELIR